MKKYTLLIDGNFFLFRSLYIMPKSGKNAIRLNTEKETQNYIRKLSTDLSYQIRLFSSLVDKIVWTIDSKSWRKDFFPESDYKGNRSDDETLNWNNFKRASSDFIEILKSKNIIISKIDGAEGDDLIYAWNNHLISTGKSSTIIITGDRDLNQLVFKNESKNKHSILFSPVNNKLYAYIGFSKWLNKQNDNSGDFFEVLNKQNNLEIQERKKLNNIIKTKKLNISEVDVNRFIWKKILMGDRGDNVMSAYWYTKTSKNGKTRLYGISENKADKILDSFIDKHNELNLEYLYDEEYLQELCNVVFGVLKPKYMSRETILINIKNNINLMVLDSKVIPTSIMDEILKSIKNCDINDTNIKESSSMNKLLEGTKYYKEKINISTPMLEDDEDDEDFSFIKKNDDKKKTKQIF